MKFLSNLSGQLKTYLGEITSAVHVRMEPKHPLGSARQHYELLQRAISAKKKVRLRYHSLFDGGEIGLLLSPYAMLFSRRSWYVIGRSSLHRSIRTFHVGRILESTLTEDAFAVPPRFSVSQHLGLAWHLIREPDQKVDVRVRFRPLVAANVAEVVWHPTQRVEKRPDGAIDFRVTVEGIREIAWWIWGTATRRKCSSRARSGIWLPSGFAGWPRFTESRRRTVRREPGGAPRAGREGGIVKSVGTRHT